MPIHEPPTSLLLDHLRVQRAADLKDVLDRQHA